MNPAPTNTDTTEQMPACGPAPHSPTLDCETAALMRGWMLPILDRAASWQALCETLHTKGYALGFREGHLCLTDQISGSPVCTLRSLGTGLRELVTRLGRPVVRPSRDTPAMGELKSRLTPSA